MRLFYTLPVLALLVFSSPACSANFGKNGSSEPDTRNRVEIPVETNINIGNTILDKQDDFPRGKNNFKPKASPNYSVAPELKKHVCVGIDCACDSGEGD